MNTYIPDGWVITKITSPQETLFKVFASWSGSYIYGESWTLNSGIKSIEKHENFLRVYGYSGSIYDIYYSGENRLSFYNKQILDNLLLKANTHGFNMEVVSLEQFLMSNPCYNKE